MINKIFRLIYTVVKLKWRQIFYQLYYRVRADIDIAKGYSKEMNKSRQGIVLCFIPFIKKYDTYKSGSFCFLNYTYSFGETINKIDWDFDLYGKLWSYNLNYFDYLHQDEMDNAVGVALIMSYIDNVKKGSIGLDSYTVSLRGVNWIKYISINKLNSKKIDAFLYAQYQILNTNLEYHLLGNHLLENSISLLFGSFYFHQYKWYTKSYKLLQEELKEQILDDGAHFELSPMYHQVLLDRLLDCINLLMHNNCFEGQEHLLKYLREKAIAMLSWLQSISFSDGSIPHFNDATNGIAPSSMALFQYASRLLIDSGFQNQLSLHESGYRKFNGIVYECIIDIGKIGPKYIPGHAHADTLNYVVLSDGKPFIVDTGTSTYENGCQRDFERGTMAHNTVTIKKKNSSDTWGSFRVGKRAKIKVLEDSETHVIAEHDGYKTYKVIHRRSWNFENKRIVVRDRILGKNISAEAHLHFDHSIKPVLKKNTVLVTMAKLSFIGAKQIIIAQYSQALGFNKVATAYCVIVQFSGELETVISFE